MILFFNYSKLHEQAKANPNRLLALLHQLYYKKIPKSSKDPTRAHGIEKIKGDNFILNPEPILVKNNTDVIYLAQYIALCSMRNYTDFKLSREKAVILSYYPDLLVHKIRSNPLVEITQTHIKLKYEEIYGH